jgi:hypothetical protein
MVPYLKYSLYGRQGLCYKRGYKNISVPFLADSINLLISSGMVASISKFIISVHTLHLLYEDPPNYSYNTYILG